VRPEPLIFLDESAAQSNMTRLYGRSRIGTRCVDRTPHGHWKTTTMLSAIRLTGVVRDATVIVDGPMNSVTFLTRVVQTLFGKSGMIFLWCWPAGFQIF
jgi:hypothetical protein